MSSCSHNIEKTELDVVGDDIHIGNNLIPSLETSGAGVRYSRTVDFAKA